MSALDVLCFKTRLQEVSIETLPDDASLKRDPLTWFDKPLTDVWLEIGFGSGEHLLAQAEKNPTVGFLGCEPFIKGVCQLVRQADGKKLNNVRVFTKNARLLLQNLKPATLGRIFIFFPDPWPKKRHEKRRLLNAFTVQLCARALKEGGQLLLVSDAAAYMGWARAHIQACPMFYLEQDALYTQENLPDGWIMTKYQKKAHKKGLPIFFFSFKKRNIEDESSLSYTCPSAL